MNNTEYWKEVKDTAERIKFDAQDYDINTYESAEEYINDCLLHETIDGHQWIIYYSYSLDILKHSDNAEYYQEVYSDSDAGQLLATDGINALHQALAFWAFYADVQDAL